MKKGSILELVLSEDPTLRTTLFKDYRSSNENGQAENLDLVNAYLEAIAVDSSNQKLKKSNTNQLEICLLKQIESMVKFNLQKPEEEIRIKIIPILLSLLCDFVPNSPVHKLSIRTLRSKPAIVDILKAVKDFHIIILEQYLPSFYCDIDAVLDHDKLLAIVEALDCLFSSLRSLFMEFYSELDSDTMVLVRKSIDSINSCDQQTSKLITSPVGSELIRQSSTIFASLSTMFQNQYRLSNWLLQKLFDSSALESLELSPDTLQQYLNSIPTTLNYGAFAAGVIIEGSLLMVRLLFLMEKLQRLTKYPNEEKSIFSAKCFVALIDYIDTNLETIGPKIPINLLSACLLEFNNRKNPLLAKVSLYQERDVTIELGNIEKYKTPTFRMFEYSITNYWIKNLCPLKIEQLVRWPLLFKMIVELWPCRTESQYVYFTSLFYLNLTKLVRTTLDQFDRSANNIDTYNAIVDLIYGKIDDQIEAIIDFCFEHWSYNSIEFIYQSFANCIDIRDFAHPQPGRFNKYLFDNLYQRFYHSKQSVSVYRFLNIIHDSIGYERFYKIFGTHIVEKYRIRSSLEHFLSYSTIPTAALADNSDLQDYDSEPTTAYQPSNIYQGNVRNTDFVRFLAIRFVLLNRSNMTDLSDEMNELINDPESRYLCHYFFKTLLPKLVQIPSILSVIKGLLSSVISDQYIRTQSYFTNNYELISTILQLNRQYNLQIAYLDNDFISNYIRQVGMWHSSDELRLQALSLLIESKRSTEPLSSAQLEYITTMLKCSVAIQQASGRDQIIKLFRKLFTRLEDSVRFNQNNSKSKDSKLMPNYCEFLDQLVSNCLACLLPQKYFGRLIVYLQLIKLFLLTFICQEKIDPVTKPLSYALNQRISSIIRLDHFHDLMTMIQNSFDEIRSIALDIQILCYRWKLFQPSHTQIEKISTWSDELLEQVQPLSAQTGVCLYRMVLRFRCQSNYEEMRTSLNGLLDQLEQRVKLIDADIMASAVSKPSYPLLSAIQAVLCDELNLSSMADKYFCDISGTNFERWRKLFSRIIDQCISSCCAVSSIVCNDSPEGHIPMDQSNSKDLNNLNRCDAEPVLIDTQQDTKHMYVTSQMLLLNGWMTVKESVIILSHLVSAFPKHQPSLSKTETEVRTMISCEQAQQVIDFLYENQLNLVHRGAFEQSSYAFNKLIVSLWENGCPKCCDKFQNIIAEIGSHLSSSKIVVDDGGDINNDETELKYKTITRRSAGLPLVVQSILAAEPISNNQHLSAGSKFIGLLIEVLKPAPEKEEDPFSNKPPAQHWQIVHSLNIVKALVRDTRISERMAPWLEDIMKVTLYWFDKANHFRQFGLDTSRYTYSIQNSASMLFSSLCTRVFGVKRNKADTSRKNRMSSLLFFQSYPSLYSFLLTQLENAKFNDKTANEEDELIRENNPSSPLLGSNQVYTLYPTLIFLSRLTPSISDNNIFDVSNFIEPLSSIVHNCKDSRIRHLSVSVYSQLLQISAYPQHLNKFDQKLEQIIQSDQLRSSDNNQFHGLSLLLAELTQQYACHVESENSEFNKNRQKLSSVRPETTDPVFSILESIYSKLSLLFANSNSIPCSILLVLHQIQYRIYTLFQIVSNKSSIFSNVCRHIETSLTQLVLNSSKTFSSLSISNDEYRVNLLINNLIHFMPNHIELFQDYLLKFVKNSDYCFLEAKFVLWNFLNESLADYNKSIHNCLLRKHHQSYDSIFTGHLAELRLSYNKIMKKSDQFILNKCNDLESEKYLIELIRGSDEWNRIVSYLNCSKSNRNLMSTTVDIRNIQWDIFNEILRLIYNARKCNFTWDMQTFLELVWQPVGSGIDARPFDIELLFSAIELCEQQNDNVRCTLLLILETCLADQVPENGKALHYFQRLSNLIDSYSNNFENIQYRRTAIYCLDGFVIGFVDLFWENCNGSPEVEHRLYQIFQSLFRSMFSLLQDNEKSIRLEMSQSVRLLAGHLPHCLELSHLPMENIPLYHEVAIELTAKIYSKLLLERNHLVGILFAIDLIADIFLAIDLQAVEEIKNLNEPKNEDDLHVINDQDDQVRLFDRSKQNVYYDGYLIGDLLIRELNRLLKQIYCFDNGQIDPDIARSFVMHFYFDTFFQKYSPYNLNVSEDKLTEQYWVTFDKLRQLNFLSLQLKYRPINIWSLTAF